MGLLTPTGLSSHCASHLLLPSLMVTRYEDNTRNILGNRSYPLFTLDKVPSFHPVSIHPTPSVRSSSSASNASRYLLSLSSTDLTLPDPPCRPSHLTTSLTVSWASFSTTTSRLNSSNTGSVLASTESMSPTVSRTPSRKFTACRCSPPSLPPPHPSLFQFITPELHTSNTVVACQHLGLTFPNFFSHPFLLCCLSSRCSVDS
jgi:hypothetical protein